MTQLSRLRIDRTMRRPFYDSIQWPGEIKSYNAWIDKQSKGLKEEGLKNQGNYSREKW